MRQNTKCKWLHKSFVFLLSILVAATFMVPGSFGTQEAHAATPVLLDENWLNYEKLPGSETECRITEFAYEAGVSPRDVIIPEKLGGLTVREIGPNAFAGSGLTSVGFEKSGVRVIGDNAFAGNSFENFTIPTTVTTLGDSCFRLCAKLKSIDLEPNTAITSIPDGAFNECNQLANIKLPPNLEKIGKNAFRQTIFTYIKIPENVSEIGSICFPRKNSGTLGVIDLPNHEPNSIEGSPWHGWGTQVKWKNTNNQDGNHNSAFWFDQEQGLIYGLKSSITTNNYPDWDKNTKTLKIPSHIDGHEVKKFASGALCNVLGVSNMTAVWDVRKMVENIEFDAESKIDDIPDYTFWYLSQLKSMTNIPSTVTSIGYCAFRETGPIESLTFDNVTTVSDYAFTMTDLNKITFKGTVGELEEAFASMYSLTDVNLPDMPKDSIKVSIVPYATINWAGGGKTIPSIGLEKDTTGDWYVNKATGQLLYYLGAEQDLVVPSEVTVGTQKVAVTSIGTEMGVNILHKNTQGLTAFNSVTLPDSIREVKSHAFIGTGIKTLNLGDQKKSKLWNVASYSFTYAQMNKLELPDSVVNIGDFAFQDAPITGELKIPGNATSISSAAFVGNTGITSIRIEMYRLQDADEGAFNRDEGLYKKIPAKTLAAAPWGAANAAHQIIFKDEPSAKGDCQIQENTTSNTVTLKLKGKTNHNFYVVKKIKPGTGMPDVENEFYPAAQGYRYPATADMTVKSTTETVNGKQVQGGNGTYSVSMTYGSQNHDNANKTLPYSVSVDKFKTLIYNANGGAGTVPAAEAHLKGHTFKLPNATITRSGYTFGGWQTAAAGGTSYNAGANYTMPDGTTNLYAKWNANTYDVVFNANGGKFKDNKETKSLQGKTDQEILKITGHEQPTRSGYGFVGWATTQGASVANATTVPVNGTTVYAVWKQGTTNAILDANGGKFGNVTEKNVNGTTENKLNTFTGYQEPTREGYTFKGWATSATATTGQAGSAISVPGDGGTKYYAVWQINKYDVTFNGNGGTIGGSATKKINDEYNKDLTKMTGYVAPIREGYNFRGWATSAGATTPNITTVPAKAQTVYAVWQIKSDIEVTFNANGGKFGDADENVVTGKYSDAFIDLFDYDIPERKYYTFKGWATTADATATNINAVPAANATVYAVWEETPATDAEKDAFRAEIEAVKKDSEETKVSTDGKDVSEKDQWVPKEEKDKIDKAAADAEAVLNTDGVTGKQIAEGSEALKASKDEFDKAKKEGSKETADAEAALAKAKSDAKAELDKVDVNLYEEPELSVVKKAVDDGKKEIDASTTIPQVDAAKKKALDTIAAQKTAAQKADEKKKTEDPKNIPTEVTDKTPANLVAVTTAITTAKNDGDLKGSTYAPLKFQSKKQTKKSIKLQWSKVKGAKQYTVYANQCGTKNKYKKLATVKGKTLNVKKVAGKKLKKGVSYKFLIIAENGDQVSAISKTLHIRTAGHKKYTNYKSVSVKNTVIKKAKKLKKGKTLKLNAKGVVPKGKKVSVHVKTRYESADKKVATVTKAGKVKGIKKGKTKIYCYVQNGLAKVVTVTVK